MAPSAEGPSGVPAVATISGLTASLRLPVLAALYANPEVTARGPATDAPTRCGSPGGALKDGLRGVDAEGHHQAGHRPGEPFVGAGHAVLDGESGANRGRRARRLVMSPDCGLGLVPAVGVECRGGGGDGVEG